MPRFASWSIRRKILIPFALLAVIYTVAGTYIFSRASARELHASQAVHRQDAATVLGNAITGRESSLAAAARRIVFTEGVTDAVARGDRVRLRRLVLPIAGNVQSSVIAVTDGRGISLLEVSVGGAGPANESAGGDWSGVPFLATVLEEGTTATALSAGILERPDALLGVAAPVSLEGVVIGAVIVGEDLGPLLDNQQRLTRSSLAILGPDGRHVVGARIEVGRSAGGGATEAGGSLRGKAAGLLFAPMTLRGEPAGTIVVALPEVSGLSALGDDAAKIFLLAIGAIVGVFLIGSTMARWISRPILSLVGSARALRGGELSHRATLDQGGEVGELARSFNEMATELEKSHGELEDRVEQRTRELAETLVDLKRANEAKSLFLANVSHELRTPLSSIIIGSEMLQDPEGFRLSGDRVRDLGARIHSGGQYLLALIDDLLDLGRIESGNLDLRVQALALAPLIEEVREAIVPIAEQKGVSVEIPAIGDSWLRADPVRLRQVLFNLLTNAVKFTDRGGRVSVRVSRSKAEVRIAVRDTGIGIARSDLAKIFEPFEQVSRTRAQGSGLGLAISKRIVEMQDGRITVSSATGKGSTFTVALPRAVGQIVVVEDDAASRELVAGTAATQVPTGASARTTPPARSR